MPAPRARFLAVSARALVCLTTLVELAACGSERRSSPSVSSGGSLASGGHTSLGSGGDGGSAGTPDSSAGSTARGVPFSSYHPTGDPIELASVVNASDIAWKPSTDTFFVVADRVSQFYEYGPDFTKPVRVIELSNPPVDAEGLTYLGLTAGRDVFAFSTEAPDNSVLIFELDPHATSLDFAAAVRRRFEPIGPSIVPNKGLEGVAYRPSDPLNPARFYVCEEGDPGQEPIRLVNFDYDLGGPSAETYRDGSLVVNEPWRAADKFDPSVADLSGLHYDVDSDTLLVLSDLGSRLLRVAPESGEVFDELLLNRSPQYEGVTLASGGRLVFVSEPNFIEVFSSE